MRRSGVKAAMFVRDAGALCPHLVIIPYDFEAYEDVCFRRISLFTLYCFYRKWGFEKLVYKDVKKGIRRDRKKKGIRRDRKYAVQPRNVYATGVHMSQNLNGKTTHKTESRIKYFHYHGTIAWRREYN